MDNSTVVSLTGMTVTKEMQEDSSMLCNSSLFNHLRTFTSYYMPLLVSCGLTGNILSILVFTSTKLKHIPASHYLASLAVVDCGVLLIDLFSMCGGKALMSLDGWCQMVMYAHNVFCFLSVWFVVSFTSERFLAVRYPLHRLRWCTVERCRTTIVFLVGFAALWNIYILVTTKPVQLSESNQTLCSPAPYYMNTVFVFNYFDVALTLLVPFCVIIVLNLSISVKLLYRSPAKQLVQLTVNSTGAFLRNDYRRHSNAGHEKKDEKVTKVLLIVSMVFLMMNLPDHVLRLSVSLLTQLDLWSNIQPAHACRILLAQIICSVIFQTNFAINFFLYNLVGKNFRRHVRNLLASWIKTTKMCFCRKRSSSSTFERSGYHSTLVSRQNSAVTTVF